MSDAPDPRTAHDRTVDRHVDHFPQATPEEHRFLDALVFLRRLYTVRGPLDRESVESLQRVIADADRQMRATNAGMWT
jgi:hypothetical protein